MPLDGHSYLVAQGWEGKGSGLREGAISRPLAIPQKKNLAGLGKDRDEAFPFWDHLFSAAAKSIKVKCLSDDEDNSDSDNDSSAIELKRTTTGILSNRRPVTSAAASSGSNTPDSDAPPRYNLLVTAKREAAKRGLYARFFRGPILGPKKAFAKVDETTISVAAANSIVEVVEATEVVAVSVSERKQKKRRKLEEACDDSDKEKRERKRRKEAKEQERKERRGKKREKEGKEKKISKKRKEDITSKKRKGKEMATEEDPGEGKNEDSLDASVVIDSKSEKKHRKEEKKRRKLAQRCEGSENLGTSNFEPPGTEELTSEKKRPRSSDEPEDSATPNPKSLDTVKSKSEKKYRKEEKKRSRSSDEPEDSATSNSKSIGTEESKSEKKRRKDEKRRAKLAKGAIDLGESMNTDSQNIDGVSKKKRKRDEDIS